MVGAIAAALV